MEFVALWWLAGFGLALLARQALVHGTAYRPKPIMYRTLIGCALAGVLGLLLVIPAMTWSVMYFLGDNERRKNSWLDRPVFRRED